eukprot:SAG22_NODE_10_length_35702_cov_72.266992_11_plen_233_part_00
MKSFFRSMVGGAAKRVLPSAAGAEAGGRGAREPVTSLLEKQRQLEAAALEARAGQAEAHEEITEEYKTDLFSLGGTIRNNRIDNIVADGVRTMDHRDAWHENSRDLPGLPSRSDLPSHVAARGGGGRLEADGGLPPGRSTMEDWSLLFTKLRHDPEVYTASVLGAAHNLTETQVEAALRYHRPVLVLGNTRGQQLGAWDVPVGVHASGRALAETGQDGWYLEEGQAGTRHRE